jgi:NAD(P)-dependent dehydrogenase (short-subunit alcohol dehydrogenase family)
MNRQVLITGGSKGLGLSLAESFLAQGDHVHIISRKGLDKKHLPVLPANSGILTSHLFDVSKEGEIKKFASRFLKATPMLDILVNNAGYGGTLSRIEETKTEEFQKFLDMNLKSAFLMSKYFLPKFRKQKKGLILNVSSMAGVRGVPRLFAYSASKFGMHALTECIVKENEDLPFLKCYTIAPGGMNTGMRAAIFGKKDAEKQQSTEFVSRIIHDVLEEKIPLNNGSTIVIRHGKVSQIIPLPGA